MRRVRSRLSTLKHKAWVAWFMGRVCWRLMVRALVHDASKMGRAEVDGFARANRLRDLQYDSAEYHEARRAIGDALAHHYAANSHHPEHHGGRVGAMPLLDQVEMLCDWAAAVRRHADGSLERSIMANAARFGYGDEVAESLRATAREIGALPREREAA